MQELSLIHISADGFSLDDKRSPIAENDIPDIIERFKNLDKEIDRKRTDKSFMVPKQDIVENGYDLSINKYKEIEYVPAVSYTHLQGSEFDYVYIIIPKRDSHLLSMELLYTAVTRAQKKVTVLLQEDMGTLTSLGHIEKSAVRRINSSVFRFEPLPEELLYIQNWYADEKKLATLSEYFVRSKSEVIIANMLVEMCIRDSPFIYQKCCDENCSVSGDLQQSGFRRSDDRVK